MRVYGGRGMPEDEDYECPECRASISTKMTSCPGCGLELEWDEEEETLDELMASADKLLRSVEEYEAGPEPRGEVEIPEEDLATPPEEPPTTPAKGPKRYGPLSLLGVIFALLFVLAIILTLVAANYDVWVQGAEEENIGPTQQNAIYLGIAGIVVCLLVVVWDWWRNRA